MGLLDTLWIFFSIFRDEFYPLLTSHGSWVNPEAITKPTRNSQLQEMVLTILALIS